MAKSKLKPRILFVVACFGMAIGACLCQAAAQFQWLGIYAIVGQMLIVSSGMLGFIAIAGGAFDG